jgi:hypothetical protein
MLKPGASGPARRGVGASARASVGPARASATTNKQAVGRWERVEAEWDSNAPNEGRSKSEARRTEAETGHRSIRRALPVASAFVLMLAWVITMVLLLHVLAGRH